MSTPQVLIYGMAAILLPWAAGLIDEWWAVWPAMAATGWCVGTLMVHAEKP